MTDILTDNIPLNTDNIQGEDLLLKRPNYDYGLSDQGLDIGTAVNRSGFKVVEFRTPGANGDYELILPFDSKSLQYTFVTWDTGGAMGTGWYNYGEQGCTLKYKSSSGSYLDSAYSGKGIFAFGGSGTKITITDISNGIMKYTVSDYTTTFRGFIYCY